MQRVTVVGVGMGDRLVTGVRLWLQGMQIEKNPQQQCNHFQEKGRKEMKVVDYLF